ncbi:hypothetical protein [Rhizobium leguminosarum]|uniref:Uncharacterized protein n=1 Tax=Rhizobium leguminosarum TaxID=384 RepID=A0A1B1C3Z5_RHILE|nr:hypothetical protein [Rhizobium leguminosarum]ANP84450.1 hypothetical protein BA011_00975 [Rhizobium leguminosarum]
MIDPDKILPSWRFALDPALQIEAKKFYDFVDYWPPYGWSDDQIKRWVEKGIVGEMSINWPLIHHIDQKLDGLVSKTLMLMCHRPRDLPPGHARLFGKAFFNVSGAESVRHAMRYMIDHKLKGGPRRTALEPGEEEYDDGRIIALSSVRDDAVHRSDLSEDARDILEKKEEQQKLSVNLR